MPLQHLPVAPPRTVDIAIVVHADGASLIGLGRRLERRPVIDAVRPPVIAQAKAYLAKPSNQTFIQASHQMILRPS